ncbi:MAG: orotate phosphoribosyltransferase [bacterium]|nr:orotate phosphoribosyltransferase [bacterium]MBK6912047.1 orotate phosphoribosyltransferase [bacterium]
MNQEIALDLLRECGAFLEGHFLLSSGRHSDVYVEKFRLLERPELTEQFAHALANHFRIASPDLVVGPLTGGVLVAHEVGKDMGVQIAFPERVDGRMEWRRGFEIQPGQRVLICEDVITTGLSVGEVKEAIERDGGNVIGIGALIQRGDTHLSPTPYAVVKLALQSFAPADCPFCLQGVPLSKRGSRVAV